LPGGHRTGQASQSPFSLLDLEEMDESELDKIRDRYEKVAAKSRKDGMAHENALAANTNDAKNA
jgi:hypothetical protein